MTVHTMTKNASTKVRTPVATAAAVFSLGRTASKRSAPPGGHGSMQKNGGNGHSSGITKLDHRPKTIKSQPHAAAPPCTPKVTRAAEFFACCNEAACALVSRSL